MFSKWLIMILTKINEKSVEWVLTFLLKNDIDLSFKVKEIRIIEIQDHEFTFFKVIKRIKYFT